MWKEFIQSHLAVLAGIDFFTVEVLAWRGLVTYYVWFHLVGIPELRQERGSAMRPSDSFHIYESATYVHMASVTRVYRD